MERVISVEEKEEIIKNILKELESKKLIKGNKSAFKSTEKILYSYKVLPEALNLINEEIKQLENDLKEIPKPTSNSNTLVLKERDGTYVYGNETLENRISELKQIAVNTKSQIRLVDNALKKIENHKYYGIISKYYFDKKTIETIAEEFDCAVSTVSANKKDLINKLKIYIFPNTFMEEL